MSSAKQVTYAVQGMHCASCELLLEKKIAKVPGVQKVKASVKNSQVVIDYVGDRPEATQLSALTSEEGYSLTEAPSVVGLPKEKNILTIAGLALLLVMGFLILGKSGLSGKLSVGVSSPLPSFFVFGLLAGVSSCAALVGGIILSMSKQWSELYGQQATFIKRSQPHWLFNFGRLVSYTLLGGILGAIGGALKLSLSFYSILIFAVSVMMIFLGLQMLGVRAVQRFQLRLPKFFTRYITDESKFKGRYMPFIMGALTFFLPCGFTITAQGLALLSGSPVHGALIMVFFALGTLPMLLAIGLSSIKFYEKPRWAGIFSAVAGVLVLFFALYNVNAQLNVLGAPSLSNFLSKPTSTINSGSAKTVDDYPPGLVDGKQVLKMEASSSGYRPNNFKVAVNVPVRWEINDTGTSGCTNAVISRSLFDGQIDLTPGTTSIKEFTPTKVGKYKFSCWMGMISGTIEVVEASRPTGTSSVQDAAYNTSAQADSNANIAPSGASGCGCGGTGNSCSVGASSN